MRQPEVTEIQAGGAIFGDATYQMWGVPTDPALFGQAVVTSRPAPDRIITDAGFKTLPGMERQPKAVSLENVVNISASAEHGVITLSEPNKSVQGGRRARFHRRLRRRHRLPARRHVRSPQRHRRNGLAKSAHAESCASRST